MIRLIDLLYEYPVLEALVAELPLDGLLNLARASSLYRAILHDFPAADATNSSKIPNTIRPQLFIGKHHTKFWRRLKSKAVSRCSEPHHTKGSIIKRCRLCSMLVCESCIVKSSYFGANVTMGSRRRYLCGTCWNTGNRHRERQLNEAVDRNFCSYQRQAEIQGFCTCSVQDKWLCLQCIQKQPPKMPEGSVQCAGEGCFTIMRPESCGGRLCVWCDLPLMEKLSREQARRDYDLKHLCARAHSAIHVEDLISSDDEGNPSGEESLQSPPEHASISQNDCKMDAKFCQFKGLSFNLSLRYHAMKKTLRSIVLGSSSQVRGKRRLIPGMQTQKTLHKSGDQKRHQKRKVQLMKIRLQH